MNGYNFKVNSELGWAVVGAVTAAVATVLVAGGFEEVTTWEGLASMLSAAGARSVGVAIRAAAGAVLAQLRPS